MKLTINIDLSNNKAIALLNYIKTLDFIKVEEDNSTLTKEDKKKLNEAIKSLDNSKGISHQNVLDQTKNKFPNLFK
jgi:hypothetical protein